MASRKISGPIVGESEQIRMLLAIIKRVALYDVSVLILGETGAGKELVAREIHRLGGRNAGPIIVVNCSAIPEALLEAELFGWEAGAFTGAIAQRIGLLEQANGGILFLDEIGDMPLGMQAKLLRVIQERELVRLGSTAAATPIPINMRVVAATHHDIESEVNAGRFRADLFYRLGEYKIRVPALRERPDDAVQLARHFIEEFAPSKRLARSAGPLLEAHNWPGNVRELRAVVRAAAIDVRGLVIRPIHILSHLPESTASDCGFNSPRSTRITEYLREHGASSAKEIAAALGIPKSTLHALLNRLANDDLVDALGKGRNTRFAIPQAGSDQDALTARQQAGLKLIKEEGSITRAEYAKRFDVSPSTASRDLGGLIELDLLERDGEQGRKSGYQLLLRDALN